MGRTSEDRRSRAQPRVAIAATTALVAALALTACSGTANTTTPVTMHSSRPVVATGQLEGTLLISPPFQRQYPTSGTIVITGDQRLTRHVGADGQFTLAVEPGRYTVVGHTSRYMVNGRQGDCITQAGPLVVQPHRTLHVTVLCAEK